MIEQKKILTRHVGRTDMIDVENYRKDGGYNALKKALDMAPKDIVNEVRKSMLRGHGGAGFPTGVKWGFLPKDSDKPVYLVCNADEGEPGTFKDRQIMEYDPHLLIEGMVIAGYAIGATLGFIYIRGEFKWIAEILERAIENAREANILGENIMGSGYEFDILVMRGAGAYVCGEETALIESLEGQRGMPRLKPPFPAIVGVYDAPTIVNNVETLSCVPYIISHGAEGFKELGSFQSTGTKLYGICGHVKNPGVYEFPFGTSLYDLIYQAAGGIREDKPLKAVIPGGLSSPILTPDEIDIQMDFDSCIKAGTMLGSGGVIVMDEDTSIPEVALTTIEFYNHESCGQCTPCREGLAMIRQWLQMLLDGNGTKELIGKILDLCNIIEGTTLCPLGDAAVIPIRTMIQKFRDEFEALAE